MISRWINRLLFSSKSTKGFDVNDQYLLLSEIARKFSAHVGNRTTIEGPFVIEFSLIDYYKFGALLPKIGAYMERELKRDIESLRGYELREGKVVIAKSWYLDERQPPIIGRFRKQDSQAELDPFA